MSKNARKGQVFRRKSDGFIFVVTSASRTVNGALMQCLDASMISGWWFNNDRELSFERVSKAEAVILAQASEARWQNSSGTYPHMLALAQDTMLRNAA